MTTVDDPSAAYLANTPVLKISGGGGYYLEGAISELQRDSIQVGQTVDVFTYDTGTSVQGTVDSITDYPAENLWGSSGGDTNPNVTYYKFIVFVDESADLQDSTYAQMTFSTQTSDGSSHIYLDNAFIIRENGKSYVYVRGEKDKLEKRQVSTGGSLWGNYTEIRSDNLAEDEYIAFPYGKNVEEGAETVEKDTDSLYQ